MHRKLWPRTLTLLLWFSATSFATSRADYELVADFDDLIAGPIAGQDGWYAAASTIVTADPQNPFNQVLAVTTDSTLLYHALLVPNGTTRFVFLRFRFDGQVSCSFGLSDVAFPDEFGHFEVEFSLTNAQNDLRINDNGHYVELLSLEPGTWYNLWLFVDNTADQFTCYLNTYSFTGASTDDLLVAGTQSSFVFRNEAAGDLLNFYVKTGGGSSGNAGPLYIDDIYVESTAEWNFHNPAVQPPDLDHDGDVDGVDAAAFVDCLGGPEAASPVSCLPDEFVRADVDRDHDVDLRDFQAFIKLYSLD